MRKIGIGLPSAVGPLFGVGQQDTRITDDTASKRRILKLFTIALTPCSDVVNVVAAIPARYFRGMDLQ
jgi:hypothetical protein